MSMKERNTVVDIVPEFCIIDAINGGIKLGIVLESLESGGALLSVIGGRVHVLKIVRALLLINLKVGIGVL